MEHPQHPHTPEHQEPSDVGVHGMVVVGTSNVYAGHMPMTGPPHDHQIFMEISLDTSMYFGARRHFGTSALFTLSPEPFSIHGLKPGADGRPALREFRAELFFGHFERGGDDLGKVLVTVGRTLVFRHLDPAGKGRDLGYFLFGQGEDLFLAHEISAAPDFDQILAVQAGKGGSPFTPEQAVHLNVPGRKDTLESRLAPGEQVGAILTDETHATDTASPATIDLQVLAEVYLETSDLAR